MFSEKLKIARQKNNMTQKEFAAQLDISASAVSMYERGERMPSSSVLKKICAVSDVPADYLLDDIPSSADAMSLVRNTCDIIRGNENLTYKSLRLTGVKTKKLADTIMLISELVLNDSVEIKKEV